MLFVTLFCFANPLCRFQAYHNPFQYFPLNGVSEFLKKRFFQERKGSFWSKDTSVDCSVGANRISLSQYLLAFEPSNIFIWYMPFQREYLCCSLILLVPLLICKLPSNLTPHPSRAPRWLPIKRSFSMQTPSTTPYIGIDTG